jgi:hypothetical protein
VSTLLPVPEVFKEFTKELHDLMADIGMADAVLRLKGTSTTFYSENPENPSATTSTPTPRSPRTSTLASRARR